MRNSPIFAVAAGLGLLSGLVLAEHTPTQLKPMKQPEWRERAAALREEAEALYVFSMPEELSPSVGYGNPAWHAEHARMTTRAVWQPLSLPPYSPGDLEPKADFPPPPTPLTGNESTIAELRRLNDSMNEAAPVEQYGLVEIDLREEKGG